MSRGLRAVGFLADVGGTLSRLVRMPCMEPFYPRCRTRSSVRSTDAAAREVGHRASKSPVFAFRIAAT